MSIGSGIGTSVMTNSSATSSSINDDAVFTEFFSYFVCEVAGDTIGSASSAPRADDLQVFGWEIINGLSCWWAGIAAGDKEC